MIDALLGRYFNASIFYITVETVGRESIIIGSIINRLLRSVLNEVKQAHKFQTLGFVLLPDHIHLLIKPAERVALDTIMQALARQFESEYATLMGQPQPTQVWQRAFLARRPADQADFSRHLDWIHYNPVYHQQVEKPAGWPYSSYQAWVERGLYGAEWGESVPESIKGKRWG